MRGHRFEPPARLLLAVALGATLGSCGTFRGSIPFSSGGEAETVVDLAPGDVAFWTHFDASYRGDLSAVYGIELRQQGIVVGRTVCDPVHVVRVCTHRYNGIEDHAWDCQMGCGVSVPRGGPTVVRARFSILQSPPGLRLNEAHLVVKQ